MASLSVSSSSPARPTIDGVSAQISQLESNIVKAKESAPADMLANKQHYVQTNSSTLNGLNHLITATRRGSTSGIQDATPEALAQFERRLSLATREITYIQNNIKCSEEIIQLNRNVDALFGHELLFDSRDVDSPNPENIEQYVETTVALGRTHPLSGKNKLELRQIETQLKELNQGAEKKFLPFNVLALRVSQDIVSRLLTIPVSSSTTSSAQAGSLSTRTRVQQPTKSLPAASGSLVPRLGDTQPVSVTQTLQSLTTLQRHIDEALRLPLETLVEGRALHWHANAARVTLLHNRILAGIPGATQANLAQFKTLLSTASSGIEQIKAKIKPVLENTRKNDDYHSQIKEKIETLRSKISSLHQRNDFMQMLHVVPVREVSEFRNQIGALRSKNLSEENRAALMEVENLLPRQEVYGEDEAPLSHEEAELQMLNDATRRNPEDDLAPPGNEEPEVQFAPQEPMRNQEGVLGGLDDAMLQMALRQSGGNQGGLSIEEAQLQRVLQESRENQEGDDADLLMALAMSMENPEGKTSSN